MYVAKKNDIHEQDKSESSPESLQFFEIFENNRQRDY
jgi:hypothetical protein